MSNFRILLVEDDPLGAQVVETMLRFHQMKVDIAADATQAMQLLEQEQYNAAVLDLNLPGMDGWSLLKTIHGNPATASLTCVAITAYHEPRVEREALAAGFAGYFPKPINPKFVELLSSFL